MAWHGMALKAAKARMVARSVLFPSTMGSGGAGRGGGSAGRSDGRSGGESGGGESGGGNGVSTGTGAGLSGSILHSLAARMGMKIKTGDPPGPISIH